MRKKLAPLFWAFALSFAACGQGQPKGAIQGKSETKAPQLASSDAGAFDASVEPISAKELAKQELLERGEEGLYVTAAGREALRLFRWQEFDAAEESLIKALSTKPPDRAQLRLLLARVQDELGKNEDAAEGFSEAARAFPYAADYLNYRAARSYGKAGSDKVGQFAELVSRDSAWGGRAAFLRAEYERLGGRKEKAGELYSEFVSKELGREEDSTALISEALFQLGKLHHETKGAVSSTALSAPESCIVQSSGERAWRCLAIHYPLSPWTQKALSFDEKISQKLSGKELYARGQAYFVAMRNPKSEADFRSALRTKLSSELNCKAGFYMAKSAYKERDYGRSAPLFAKAVDRCRKAGNDEFTVKSLYQAGMALSKSGGKEEAIGYFSQIETDFPQHSYADDARLRQAEQLFSLKRSLKADALLAKIPELYPTGDMRGEAHWRIARAAYFAKDYVKAESWLLIQIASVPIEKNWWAEGQAEYWLGRTRMKMGKVDAAREAYVSCVQKYPLTYYSMQALNRLREKWPEEYQKHVEAISELHAQALSSREVSSRGVPSRAAPLHEKTTGSEAKKREVEAFVKSEELFTALQLAQLAMPEAARAELRHLGLELPNGRNQESNHKKLIELFAVQSLLDLAGDYTSSHWIGRWHAIDYRRSWPSAEEFRHWQLAYPFAFWGLVQKFAEQYSYPAHLQMAIIREESAFDPKRESWANAVGLTQMIFPTAIDHSKGSGIAVNRENLQHPVKNMTIGSHFLQSLQDAFEGRLGLMVPGYNAGRARVRSWIRSRHRLDLDEFIEKIKGDQARRYTKRVLGSYFTYYFLDTGKIPKMRNAVPRNLGVIPKGVARR